MMDGPDMRLRAVDREQDAISPAVSSGILAQTVGHLFS
jgi:hypothetical protein